MHSKTCLLAVLYLPYGLHGPPFSSDEPLRPESHLYDMATTRPGANFRVADNPEINARCPIYRYQAQQVTFSRSRRRRIARKSLVFTDESELPVVRAISSRDISRWNLSSTSSRCRGFSVSSASVTRRACSVSTQWSNGSFSLLGRSSNHRSSPVSRPTSRVVDHERFR